MEHKAKKGHILHRYLYLGIIRCSIYLFPSILKFLRSLLFVSDPSIGSSLACLRSPLVSSSVSSFLFLAIVNELCMCPEVISKDAVVQLNFKLINLT